MTEEKKKKVTVKAEVKPKVKPVKKEPAKPAAKTAKAAVKSASKPKAVAAKPEKPAAVTKHKVEPKKEISHAAAAVEKPAAQIKHPAAEKPAVHPKPAVIEKPVVHHKPAVVEKPVASVKPHSAVTPVDKIVKQTPVPAAKPAEPVKKEIPVAVKVEALAPVVEVKPAEPALPGKELELELPITVKDLAIKLQEKASILIKKLMDMRVMAGINQAVEESVVVKVLEKYGFRLRKAPGKEELILSSHEEKDDPASLKPRAPIVTFMGHVDHGKTSLLDAIRKTKVVDGEHGGITQHIGAYRVTLPHGEITFLDTPGHEAFTAMRARGAKATDIVILVVGADDGVMPQTKEAIDHAKAAGVVLIVALNKIDKPQAEPDRVKKQLNELGLVPEDWGGKTVMVPVSAKTGEGIDTLLEMIILEAQLLELKANPDRPAKGVVLEAKLIKSKGPVSTLLIQNGTLHLNQNIIVGNFYGKIRAMFNHLGHPVTKAGPGVPVEVLGITGVPSAGEQFFVIDDDKVAKELVEKRLELEREKQMIPVKRMGLEDLYSQVKEGKLKELNLVLKADAQGSLEAIKDVISKIEVTEIKLNIIHDGIGNINNSDVILAIASNALILGFNIVTDEQAKELINKEGQEVRIYNIIYELANDIKAALVGMLEPKLKRIFIGRAEVKKVFRLSTHGVIAGCMVSKGKIMRSLKVTLLRNGEVVHEGELSSLKRFKDDVREVEEGFECGIAIKGFDAVMEGDVIEAFEIKKIARTLE